mmetsp:Transcript_1369/g.3173  ORF Transcript_1369/g.3173 Transcript_1369/m.3173 type:complete len:261 (+) Transcript_1369:572-1354(+)
MLHSAPGGYESASEAVFRKLRREVSPRREIGPDAATDTLRHMPNAACAGALRVSTQRATSCRSTHLHVRTRKNDCFPAAPIRDSPRGTICGMMAQPVVAHEPVGVRVGSRAAALGLRRRRGADHGRPPAFRSGRRMATGPRRPPGRSGSRPRVDAEAGRQPVAAGAGDFHRARDGPRPGPRRRDPDRFSPARRRELAGRVLPTARRHCVYRARPARSCEPAVGGAAVLLLPRLLRARGAPAGAGRGILLVPRHDSGSWSR